jgi:hypothetical protein
MLVGEIQSILPPVKQYERKHPETPMQYLRAMLGNCRQQCLCIDFSCERPIKRPCAHREEIQDLADYD